MVAAITLVACSSGSSNCGAFTSTALEVTVVDATTGVEICNATATATAGQSSQPVKLSESGTDASCAYSLGGASGGGSGNLSLAVSAPGYETVSLPVTLVADSCNNYNSTYRLTVKLKPTS